MRPVQKLDRGPELIVQQEIQDDQFRSLLKEDPTILRISPNHRLCDERVPIGRAHEPWFKPKDYDSGGMEDSSPNPNLVERFLYDAYDKRSVLNAAWVASVDAYSFLHGFAGGKQDAVTGRIHFRNRDYDPNIMRWISRDPIGYEGSPFNLHEYVDGNPLIKTDPDGRFALLIPAVIGGFYYFGAAVTCMTMLTHYQHHGILNFHPFGWTEHCFFNCCMARFTMGIPFTPLFLGGYELIQFSDGLDNCAADARSNWYGHSSMFGSCVDSCNNM